MDDVAISELVDGDLRSLVFPDIYHLRLMRHDSSVFLHSIHSRIYELEKKIMSGERPGTCLTTHPFIILMHDFGC